MFSLDLGSLAILPFLFQTLFDNQNNAAKKDPENLNKNDSKKMSVERVYQKKTQLEHILLRPDTYIGSVEPVTQVYFSISLD